MTDNNDDSPPALPYFATVKYLNHAKNFAWLRPDDGSESVFVRMSDLRDIPSLEIGTRCKHDIEITERGRRAINVRPV